MNKVSEFKQERWNLKGIFENHEGKEFEDFMKGLDENVAEFESYRKILSSDVTKEKFLEMLKNIERISEKTSKLAAYSYFIFSMNTKDQEARSFKDKISNKLAEIENRILFFSLWFKSLDDEKAKNLAESSGRYKYFLDFMRLLKKHTLTEPEEKIINIKNTTGNDVLVSLYDVITNSFKFDIEVDGKIKLLNQEEIKVYTRDKNPEIRKKAYDSVLSRYHENKDALGEIYKGILNDWKNEGVKIRKYKDTISIRNMANDISGRAVEALLNVCRKNISIFQKYFKLKSKLIGMKKLRRYDIYAPLEGSEKEYSFDEGAKLVLGCYEKFSPEIAKLARKMFEDKHIDSVVEDGKMSGAYCYGVAPGMTPYILINYTGRERDVMTLAHELGHGVHDLLASENSILTFHPPLILAETASIFGEMIVTEKLLEDVKDIKEKQKIISSKLDDIYASIIRQAYFVMFELEAHKSVEEGATVDKLSEIYLNNLKEQFGDAVDVDENFKNEWMYIPHIYHTPFYCYAYAFGNLLTLALYKMYKEEGESFVPKYIKFLSYGGSEKPEKIGRELGIDFESEEFWQKGFDIINEMAGELEILGKNI